ncbi:MAG: DUF4301 family protein [Bacteroidales bacterium]
MLQQDDLRQIEKKGIPIKILEQQLDRFGNGFPFIRLLRPAIQGDGITTFNEQQKNDYIKFFEKNSPSLRVIKFVPASGAASRMFKHLFEFRESLMATGKIPDSYFSDKGINSAFYFFQNLPRFAFFQDLRLSLEKYGRDLEKSLDSKDFITILDHFLGATGLNYAANPKALLAFHNYKDGSRVALEEHLVEAVNYTRGHNGIAKIHFTVSPEHMMKFEEKIAKVRSKYEDHFQTQIDVSYSIQRSSTDTIAVDEENNPFRSPDGTLLFRPAGHGALLANLNDLDADLIFIKNIDNIVPDRLKPQTFEYKKLLGGYLLKLRQTIFDFLRNAEAGDISSEEISKMASFASSEKLLALPVGFENESVEKQLIILTNELNRPIRVCGMVRNEGEPGGGPFWVADKDRKASLQIVESSQVDLTNTQQAAIFKSSTHFNPVDLVCCTIDYKGNPFNLTSFVDDSTGLITQKSSGGRTLKAQELPGLWNGSMAAWITLFVEVPLITFNPVKTINDLLRDEHQ